jgi:hypothetical protein
MDKEGRRWKKKKMNGNMKVMNGKNAPSVGALMDTTTMDAPMITAHLLY